MRQFGDADGYERALASAGGVADGRGRGRDRDFGYGAARVPKLGVDTGIVVLRSDL